MTPFPLPLAVDGFGDVGLELCGDDPELAVDDCGVVPVDPLDPDEPDVGVDDLGVVAALLAPLDAFGLLPPVEGLLLADVPPLFVVWALVTARKNRVIERKTINWRRTEAIALVVSFQNRSLTSRLSKY